MKVKQKLRQRFSSSIFVSCTQKSDQGTTLWWHLAAPNQGLIKSLFRELGTRGSLFRAGLPCQERSQVESFLTCQSDHCSIMSPAKSSKQLLLPYWSTAIERPVRPQAGFCWRIHAKWRPKKMEDDTFLYLLFGIVT